MARLGVRCVKDLLYLFPRRYEDRRDIKPISDVKVDEVVSVRGTLLLTSLRDTRRGMKIFEAVDDKMTVEELNHR